MIDEIQTNLEQHLTQILPDHPFKEILIYATLPAGKLFRPQLVWSLAKDLGDINENQKYFASSIEIHHAYTLVHDDLPAMDNDDIRRGRASTHKKFNEWKAILAGDALLNASFGLLGKIHEPQKLSTLLYLYSEYTGAKGLILGQVLDLEDQNKKNFEQLLKIHSLKTSRLMQLSLLGTNLLATNPIDSNLLNEIGGSLGILFQLLDDLVELKDEISDHEKSVNPFINFNPKMVMEEIKKHQTKLINTLLASDLTHLTKVIKSYLMLSQNLIFDHRDKIKEYITDIDSIMLLNEL